MLGWLTGHESVNNTPMTWHCGDFLVVFWLVYIVLTVAAVCGGAGIKQVIADLCGKYLQMIGEVIVYGLSYQLRP